VWGCGVNIEEQKKLLDRGVEVFDAENPTEPRCIPLADLSPKQRKQVFADGRVRSLAEQRTWLAEHAVQPEVRLAQGMWVGW
jgi:hypothetical protein